MQNRIMSPRLPSGRSSLVVGPKRYVSKYIPQLHHEVPTLCCPLTVIQQVMVRRYNYPSIQTEANLQGWPVAQVKQTQKSCIACTRYVDTTLWHAKHIEFIAIRRSSLLRLHVMFTGALTITYWNHSKTKTPHIAAIHSHTPAATKTQQVY